MITVDADGVSLRHAILGMDTQTTSENKWLSQTFGAEELFQRTGIPMHTMSTITKLLWLKKHEPGLYSSARQFLLYEDYFLRRLDGKALISYCLASRTQMYDFQADIAKAILEGLTFELRVNLDMLRDSGIKNK